MNLLYSFIVLVLSILIHVTLAKVDFRQTEANKAFIASIPEGDYEVVHPFQIRDKNERIGIDTRNYFLKAQEHYQHVTIVIRSTVIGRLKLVVERNNFIFLNQTSFRKLDNNGEHPLDSRVENCYYQGHIAGHPSSFVALSSCNGLRGVLAFANGSTYGIWPLDGGDRGRRHPHLFYKTQWNQDARCGTTQLTSAQDIRTRVIRDNARDLHEATNLHTHHKHRKHRRDLSKQTKYIEIAILGDYEFMKQHDARENEAVSYILEAVNIADLILSRDLNIHIAVVYSELWLDVQRIDLYEDIERTLTGVVDYATGHIYHIQKDATIVFTGGSFANSEVINAGFQSICTARSSAIVKGIDEFVSHWSGQILSQAVGHLLGLEHDTSSCQCDIGPICAMGTQPGAVGSPFVFQFSKCSVARMHGVWQAGQVQCLLNKPFQTSNLRECGNGVVDGFEECDCGSREECNDPCCDALTCTLKPHAQCAAHHECCHRCELKKVGEICRAARSSCDMAEMCDGKSGDCPADGHFVDGTPCGEDGQCWRGNCSDPQSQCKSLWGKDANVAESACFEENAKGHEYAHCGMSAEGRRACKHDDSRCGTLHCQGGTMNPLNPSLRSFTFQFQHEGMQVQCKSIADPVVGLSSDGSSCGSGRVCVAGSCVEMSSVSHPVSCPSNNNALQCSGHGDCTTTSICVCYAGWAGRACDIRTNLTLSKHRLNDASKITSVIPAIAMGKSLDTATLLGILLVVGVALLLLLVCLLFCYRRRTSIEIPTPSDEKLNESLPDPQRSIKFGNMPSYREEKRKKRSNKRIYGALNRITEADERDSASLRSRESGSQGTVGSQHLFEARPIPSSRSDVGVPVCSRALHTDHIYAESAVGIGYRNHSPLRSLDSMGYSSDAEAYGMRSFGSWRHETPEKMSPSGSSSNGALTASPLRLNNIGQMLRKLQRDDSMPDTNAPSMQHATFEKSSQHFGSFSHEHRPISGEEEMLTAVDHERLEGGSNTESSRGYESDTRMRQGSLTSPDHNGGGPQPFDFRQSPSLFNDTFKLEMSTSMHT